MKDKEKQSQNNYSSSLGPNNNYYSTNVIKDKEMSIDSSSMNDVSEYMNTIKDENYRNYIQKKYELIARTFHEMDQDNNNYIDCDEMIKYLNKQMPVSIYLLNRKVKNLIRRCLPSCLTLSI